MIINFNCQLDEIWNRPSNTSISCLCLHLKGPGHTIGLKPCNRPLPSSVLWGPGGTPAPISVLGGWDILWSLSTHPRPFKGDDGGDSPQSLLVALPRDLRTTEGKSQVSLQTPKELKSSLPACPWPCLVPFLCVSHVLLTSPVMLSFCFNSCVLAFPHIRAQINLGANYSIRVPQKQSSPVAVGNLLNAHDSCSHPVTSVLRKYVLKNLTKLPPSPAHTTR